MATQSVGVVVIDNNKVLLVRHNEGALHKTGSYGLPGGRLNPRETEKEAAHRELQEESGLLALDVIEFPDNLFHARLQMKHGPEDFDWRVFLVKSFTSDLKNSDETTPEWVSIEKLNNYALIGNVFIAIERANKFLNENLRKS